MMHVVKEFSSTIPFRFHWIKPSGKDDVPVKVMAVNAHILSEVPKTTFGIFVVSSLILVDHYHALLWNTHKLYSRGVRNFKTFKPIIIILYLDLELEPFSQLA
jgi:hypothetical protein